MKLYIGDLNSDLYPSYPTRTCTCEMTIMPKVCGDIYAKLTNKLDN